jgi:hypothetical protein
VPIMLPYSKPSVDGKQKEIEKERRKIKDS